MIIIPMHPACPKAFLSKAKAFVREGMHCRQGSLQVLCHPFNRMQPESDVQQVWPLPKSGTMEVFSMTWTVRDCLNIVLIESAG